ncbi:polyprenyl synthetase family protein [Thiorhodovibrio frisius]|uniref:Geranylgeranyl pyrophosphate synthase n=1 Tax=Thiorhodovibrio frisius TaxID=631362 RepID=H8Z6M0_9GAMM|nr:farnesyl diphosphate synthase [Thiorhodovibrio frisius]EIC19718.1 geranylgeranyl pyrophosphate synthase [Thiorhodovibrio frisius]WPL20314.1 Farnesyl diphosphate synthase [Thiorhodovibrio frisius]
MANKPLKQYLKICQARVERAFEMRLPSVDQEPARLHQAMRHGALGGGKRLRPTLAYAAASAVGVTREQIDAAACALELIHTYSLIHDDLPAMDDDDLRRGQPTCHKAFDEATAILAGDALQTLAFQWLATDSANTVDARIRMIEVLARAAGSRGMVAGQALDLASEGQALDRAALENIHLHKTGALIQASVNMAALVKPETTGEQASALDGYARCIGLAFQIQDDLLDVEGQTEVLGKQSGQDAAHHKATYPSLLGIDAAHKEAARLIEEAHRCLSGFDSGADPLRWIADYIIARDH